MRSLLSDMMVSFLNTEQDFHPVLFEINDLSLTHILGLGMQLETPVSLTDGTVWTVGLWKSHTPLCAPSLLPRKSASTVTHTHTHAERHLIPHGYETRKN